MLKFPISVRFIIIIYGLGKNYTADRVVGDDNKKYDPAVNPSTTLEFSAGAFRVLHNIIPTQHKYNIMLSIYKLK